MNTEDITKEGNEIWIRMVKNEFGEVEAEIKNDLSLDSESRGSFKLMVNSIINEDGTFKPSKITDTYVTEHNSEDVIILTPELVCDVKLAKSEISSNNEIKRLKNKIIALERHLELMRSIIEDNC